MGEATEIERAGCEPDAMRTCRLPVAAQAGRRRMALLSLRAHAKGARASADIDLINAGRMPLPILREKLGNERSDPY
jgi:hypothetical protein